MPYRSAYLWTTLVGLLVIPAFWRGYFGRLGEAEAALHIHAVTATLWIALLALQAWSAHRKMRIGLHRGLGRTSLFYFPVFAAGSALVVWSMAHHTAFGDSKIYEAHGEGLGAYDIIGVLAICWFYYRALTARRDVHVHARYMIGTLFVLLGPVLARLLAIPFFMALGESWQPAAIFYLALMVTQALIVLLALLLYRWAPIRGRRPMMVIAAVVAAQAIMFALARESDVWREIFIAMGGTSPFLWATVGFAVGLAASWAGWRNGYSPPRQPSSAEPSAIAA